MLNFRRKFIALAGVGGTMAVLTCWYFWPEHRGPIAQLIPAGASVSYEAQATKLTAIVNIANSGDRPIVASITNDVFIDSQKQGKAEPSRTELGSNHSHPVTFVLQGESAAAVWNGVRLMELTINADYDEDARLKCHFSFMGRFYPELKQIGIVSSATSPRECRRR